MADHADHGHSDIQVIKKATIFADAEYTNNLRELKNRAREVKAELRDEEERERQMMSREKTVRTKKELLGS